MAQSSQHSSTRGLRRGYIWVWLADGLGIAIASGLIAAAAGAPALEHMAGWLIMALPLAGFAMAAVSDRRLSPQAPRRESAPMRTIVITPRPDDARGRAERVI